VFSIQCFSSVVGPNGSGKSNVIDAMLFVFGKKAKQVTECSQLPSILFYQGEISMKDDFYAGIPVHVMHDPNL
jgi:AAA15 family ATPase/GTPase